MTNLALTAISCKAEAVSVFSFQSTNRQLSLTLSSLLLSRLDLEFVLVTTIFPLCSVRLSNFGNLFRWLVQQHMHT